MKRLILVRHAKSSWAKPTLADKMRPLNERGQTAAKRVGVWLAENGYQPDQVLSSTAERCRETWNGLAQSLEKVSNIQFSEFLYLATSQDMLSVLQTATGETVMMLGHMPGLGEFARNLRRDPPPNHPSFQEYPTAAVTVLDFLIDEWEQAEFGNARFVEYITPRDLGA
ncbi:MAG: histidine phosphatase family protein [Rhodobacteraceae bacterium]|nr:histidine phosphatase family protein [Paracoccaceae bacterium]